MGVKLFFKNTHGFLFPNLCLQRYFHMDKNMNMDILLITRNQTVSFFKRFNFFFFFWDPEFFFFCLNFEAVAVKKKNKKYEQNDFELTWQKKKNRSRHILKIINKRTNPSHYINVIINKPILLSNVHQTGSHKLFFFQKTKYSTGGPAQIARVSF